MFSWQEQNLTRSLRSLVKYCSCHLNIKFISSYHRVIPVSSIYFQLFLKMKAIKVKCKICKRKQKTGLMQFQLFIFYMPACLQKIFPRRLLSGLSVGFWAAGSVHKVAGSNKACTPFNTMPRTNLAVRVAGSVFGIAGEMRRLPAYFDNPVLSIQVFS